MSGSAEVEGPREVYSVEVLSQVGRLLPVILNDSPKKVARHSPAAINCRKTKGIRPDHLFWPIR